MTGLDLTAVKLHENQVPDLHDRVAWSIHVRGGVFRVVRTRSHVVVNLTAWTTRAGLAHLPEIIFLAEAQDAFARRAGFRPETLGIFIRRDILVAAVNGEPQTVRIQFQNVDEQVPRVTDRVLLEVIAEGKIAEHLEERVMPRSFSDFIEVVVLAAGANALLRRCRAHVVALLAPEKSVFELIHARVSEQERRIVRGQKRRGAHAHVAVLLEIFQKNLAYFVTCHCHSSLAIWIEECTYLVRDEFKLKALDRKSVEKFLRFFSCLRPAAQANAFLDGRVVKLLFRR